MANRDGALPPLSSSEVLEILFGGRSGALLQDPKSRLQSLSGWPRPAGAVAEPKDERRKPMRAAFLQRVISTVY